MPTVLSGNPTGTNEESQDSAFKVGNPQIFNTPAPASYNSGGTTTLLSTDVLGGIVVVQGSGGTGAVTLTLPTAALLAAAIRAMSTRGVVPGDTVWVLIINGNTSTGSVTIAAGSGGSFDGNQNSASRVIGVGASKEVAIRFTNGVPGSEAYTIYS